MSRGCFIAIEGGEGSGKSTQAALLADALRRIGLTVRLTREPGGAPGAEAVRRLLLHDHSAVEWLPETEALLHYAARNEHVHRTIAPALAAGEWVISDRFAASTMAYQGYGSGVDRGWLARLDQLVMQGFAPDLTLVLDVGEGEAAARLALRGRPQDRYEALDGEFHRRVRDGFRAIAAAALESCRLIDGTGPADLVAERVLAAVREALSALPTAAP
jgi:dTMP kinase